MKRNDRISIRGYDTGTVTSVSDGRCESSWCDKSPCLEYQSDLFGTVRHVNPNRVRLLDVTKED